MDFSNKSMSFTTQITWNFRFAKTFRSANLLEVPVAKLRASCCHTPLVDHILNSALGVHHFKLPKTLLEVRADQDQEIKRMEVWLTCNIQGLIQALRKEERFNSNAHAISHSCYSISISLLS